MAGVIQRIRQEMLTLNRVLVSCTSDNAAVCVRALAIVNEDWISRMLCTTGVFATVSLFLSGRS